MDWEWTKSKGRMKSYIRMRELKKCHPVATGKERDEEEDGGRKA